VNAGYRPLAYHDADRPGFAGVTASQTPAGDVRDLRRISTVPADRVLRRTNRRLDEYQPEVAQITTAS
jgi:hypothetical protein